MLYIFNYDTWCALLFLVNINNLPCIIKNSKVSMYADDTSLYYSSTDNIQLNKALNEDLKKFDRWLQGNKLSMLKEISQCN